MSLIKCQFFFPNYKSDENVEYFNVSKNQRGNILGKFDAYENHLSLRIAYEILTLLVRVTYGTRDDMHPDTAQQIYFLASISLRSPKAKFTTVERVQLGASVS